MKIVTEEDFFKLPEYTLFRQWEFHKSMDKHIGNHRTLSPILIKCSEFPNSFHEVELGDFSDFYLGSLSMENWEDYLYSTDRQEINTAPTRGASNPDDLFIIYEKEDLIQMIANITDALKVFKDEKA